MLRQLQANADAMRRYESESHRIMTMYQEIPVVIDALDKSKAENERLRQALADKAQDVITTEAGDKIKIELKNALLQVRKLTAINTMLTRPEASVNASAPSVDTGGRADGLGVGDTDQRLPENKMAHTQSHGHHKHLSAHRAVDTPTIRPFAPSRQPASSAKKPTAPTPDEKSPLQIRAPPPQQEPQIDNENFAALTVILQDLDMNARVPRAKPSGPPLPPPPPGQLPMPPPPMPGDLTNGHDTYKNESEMKVPRDMKFIYEAIITAEKKIAPQIKPNYQSKPKEGLNNREEQRKEIVALNRGKNTRKQRKMKVVANIYANAIRSLVKVMYRASTAPDNGENNVLKVYDCIKQFQNVIAMHNVGVDDVTEMCDYDEVLNLVFSKEKDIGRHWHTCTANQATGDEIFSDALCEILKTGRLELNDQEIQALKITIRVRNKYEDVDLMSSDFIKYESGDPKTSRLFMPTLSQSTASNQKLKRLQIDNDIQLESLIQETNEKLQQAQNNQAQNTMNVYDDSDIDPGLTWPGDLYDAISIAFKMKVEINTLLLTNQRWIDTFLNSDITSNSSMRTEIYNQAKKEETMIQSVLPADQNSFIKDIETKGYHFDKNNFLVPRIMMHGLCSALLNKIKVEVTDQIQLTYDLACVIRFCWTKCCQSQGDTKGVNSKTHNRYMELSRKLQELLPVYGLEKPLRDNSSSFAGSRATSSAFSATLPGWTPEPRAHVAVSNHKPHRVSRMFICR